MNDRRLGPQVVAVGGQLVLWVVIPLAVCAAVVGSRHSHVWFFYDEWSIVRNVVAGGSDLEKAFGSRNGRLWAVPYVLYAVQTRAFGLDSHLFVYSALCGSLVALNIALAAALRALGVPAVLAMAASIVGTYLGVAAQLSVFAILFSWNLALAAGLIAVVLVVRLRPGAWSAAAVGALLLLATVSDSGIAAVALVLVGVFAAWCWRDRFAVIALTPAALVLLVWQLTATADASVVPSSTLGERIVVAGDLILSAAGGLMGGRTEIGAVAVALAVIVITVGITRGRVTGPTLGALVAGGVATIVTAAAVSQTRAGLLRSSFFDFNRYRGTVAVLLLVALVPAVWATVRAARPALDRGITVAATVAMIAVFFVSRAPHERYRDVFEARSRRVHAIVGETLSVIDRGCPDGTAPNDEATPAGGLSPQITVELLAELDARGLLTVGQAPSREVVAKVCGGKLLTFPVDIKN